MSKVLFLIFISFFSFSILAANRVVLMVSLNPENNRPPLRSRGWDINEKLEKIFLKKLKAKNYELVITPFTRQSELRRELLNPQNHAVFWVGHSNQAQDFTTAGMYDDRGFNMKEVFQDVHQNIKFLALVGCRALPFVQSLKSEGFWDLNSHLNFHAREKKTDARKGLKRALNAFLKSKESEAPSCVPAQKIPVVVRRSSERAMSEARILRKGRLLGTFEKDEEEITIHLEAGLKKSELKLTLESGAANNVPGENFNLGLLEFESVNSEYKWKLFADRDGNPIGFGNHVYLFRGNVLEKNNENLITEYVLPKQCKDKH